MRMKKVAALVMICAPALALTACSKPSEAEVHTAVVKILTDNQLPADQAEQVADCMAPKLVEQVSRTGLNNLIEDGEDALGTTEDETAVNSITEECITETGIGG